MLSHDEISIINSKLWLSEITIYLKFRFLCIFGVKWGREDYNQRRTKRASIVFLHLYLFTRIFSFVWRRPHLMMTMKNMSVFVVVEKGSKQDFFVNFCEVITCMKFFFYWRLQCPSIFWKYYHSSFEKCRGICNFFLSSYGWNLNCKNFTSFWGWFNSTTREWKKNHFYLDFKL